MARRKIIAGNWKMNKTPSEAVALVEELKPLVANDAVSFSFPHEILIEQSGIPLKKHLML